MSIFFLQFSSIFQYLILLFECFWYIRVIDVGYLCVLTPNFLLCFLRLLFFWPFFRETPVFTSAMPITNGRWIYEAFEQIMTLSSIREYVPSSIRKCTSIHTHSLYTNHQTKQKKSRLKSNKHEEKERSTSMIYITYF